MKIMSKIRILRNKITVAEVEVVLNLFLNEKLKHIRSPFVIWYVSWSLYKRCRISQQTINNLYILGWGFIVRPTSCTSLLRDLICKRKTGIGQAPNYLIFVIKEFQLSKSDHELRVIGVRSAPRLHHSYKVWGIMSQCKVLIRESHPIDAFTSSAIIINYISSKNPEVLDYAMKLCVFVGQ